MRTTKKKTNLLCCINCNTFNNAKPNWWWRWVFSFRQRKIVLFAFQFCSIIFIIFSGSQCILGRWKHRRIIRQCRQTRLDCNMRFDAHFTHNNIIFSSRSVMPFRELRFHFCHPIVIRLMATSTKISVLCFSDNHLCSKFGLTIRAHNLLQQLGVRVTVCTAF